MMAKKYPTIGCCGIDCGLCPRFYTEGNSRCPGCGGEGFELKHPPCSTKSCCADKQGYEVCSECSEFPCKKYENREKIEHDSFVTHKRIFQNHELIKTHGIDWFLTEQCKRVSALREMLTNFDDGRSKSFLCLAAALLPIERLEAAIAETPASEDKKTTATALKASLKQYAEMEGVSLTLRK